MDQVRKLSRSPKEEVVILLGHGDPEHELLADQLMRQLTTSCCGEAGISLGDWAFIGVGQEYLTKGAAAVHAALEHKERVIVVGMYISSSASKVHQRREYMTLRQEPGFDPFRGKDVVFPDEWIVNHADFLRWVLEAAEAAASPIANR